MHEFWAFALVGFFAQLVDGALGMGFGVISASVLLAQGVPPALASASVNAAKLPTTGTAALSHYLHKNLDWRINRGITPADYTAVTGKDPGPDGRLGTGDGRRRVVRAGRTANRIRRIGATPRPGTGTGNSSAGSGAGEMRSGRRPV